ncbi:MAG TPA: hypothetical protein VI612_00215 [Candidatus Nanoarchaeia archaeon]|nr:hypothetical protein [Candidatus Nanoarchaeia archaeon]
MKFHKKGLEMSIGLIVVLILSVLIFSLSLYMVFNWFGKAEVLKAEIDKQTQEQIKAVLASGNTLVAIPIPIQQAKRGGSVNFGIGVRNVAEARDFSGAISFSGAYTPDGRSISVNEEYLPKNWLGNFNVIQTFSLKKNEQKLIPILIKVHTNVAEGVATPKGDYVFNVCLYPAPLKSDGSPPAECTIGQYQHSADLFYTGKIYQVTVRAV